MVYSSKINRMWVTAIAAIMAAILLLAIPVQAASSFTDVPARYKDAVNYLVDNEITQGLTETEFGTHEMIKRVDAAVLLAKALKLEIDSSATSGFADVPSRAEPYVAALRAKGIVNGKDDTTFASQDNITRGEMALILARGYELPVSEDVLPFNDVADRYKEAVGSLYKYRITVGKTDTTFATTENLTRGEFALFLYRLANLELPGDKGVIDLEVLNPGLIDGSISLDDLLSNPEVLRVKLLPGSGLALGDVIKLGTNDMNLLTVSLEQNDLDNGFVDLALTTDILKTLTGGKALDLVAVVESGEAILGSATETIKLPILPLVTPVIDIAKNTLGDLAYILAGEKAFQVDIKAEGLEKVKAGDTLKLTITTGSKTETVQTTLAAADIERGYVTYTFNDTNLIQRLLEGITTGSTLVITPEITDGATTATGAPVSYQISSGLLGVLDGLLGGLLGGILDGLL
ncbi:S-layer homology domain-containing protein [Bacillus tuaregi]|uniref:S-layer homology domain-containing protein n=1 Tax=Bacillus tuaregi TaxID=1816695 RepID=UPI0008F89484|nr:S-layer homology domain-containing protein [Bacillus tuaregi]